MRARFAIAAVLCVSLVARAQNAEADLERQLKDMVGKPPTKLLVEYEGLDQPNFKLVEVSFELDGSSLPVPALEPLNGDGKHLIFHGDVRPGKHTLETTVVLTDTSAFILSAESGFRWKVKKEISFEQQPGLEVRILISPDLSPGEKDPKKKITIKSNTTVKMLAKLEDGTMPESPKPNLGTAAAGTADAGTVAEASPAEKAKVLKAAAAEEARRKKEEAAAARAAAAEEKKRKREESAAAKAAAADEKKRKKADALAAKKAAEEEKRLALAGKSSKPSETGSGGAGTGTGGTGTGEGTPGEPGQPSEPLAEEAPDAGTTVAAAEPAKPAPSTTSSAPSTESEGGGLGIPLPVLIGVGVALLGVIVFFATRKKNVPPY